MRAGDGRHVRMIEGRRDLDHVHADEVYPGKRTQNRRDFGGCQTFPDRSSSSRRIRRIKGVYVESQIGFPIAKPRPNAFGRLLRAVAMYAAGIDPLYSQSWLVLDAYADLHRVLGVDKAFLDGLIDDRAVIDAGRIVISPGVGMGIELQKCQRAVPGGMRAQNRKRDRVIPAKCQAGPGALDQS